MTRTGPGASGSGGPGTRRVFLSGQVVSVLGDGLALLAVPLMVLRVTHDPLAAGLASATRGLGYLAVGVLAGPITDRLDAVRVLVVADAVRAAAFAVLAAMALLGVRQAGPVLGVALVSAAAAVFFDAAFAITVRDLFARERVLPANAAVETASQLSRLLGPAAAGLLVASAGVPAVCLVDAGTFVVSLGTAVPLLRSRSRPGARGARPGPRSWRIGADLAAGLRYLASERLVLSLTLLLVAANLCLAVDTLIVFLGEVTLGLTSVTVGLVVAAGGAGGVAGSLAAPWLDRRFARVRLIGVALAVVALAVAAMAATGTWWTLAAANTVLVSGTTLAGLLVRSIRQEIVPRAMLGRVTATVRTLFLSATPLGTLVAGAATRAAGGPRPVFAVSGVLLAASCGIAWVTVLRHQPAA